MDLRSPYDRDEAALDQLGAEIAQRMVRRGGGDLALNGHIFPLFDARLDANGLRDLYFCRCL